MQPNLSILIPCYNEKYNIKKILIRIANQKISKELIIIDDGSTDGTQLILKKLELKKFSIKKIIYKKKNEGKGSAINSGKKFINGKYVIIQDADLEYNPKDYHLIIKKFNENKNIKCVYGSRVLGVAKRYRPKEVVFFFTVLANKMLTYLNNILNKQNLTDAHTCYKAFDSKIFKKIEIESKGFEFCPEITSKISNLGEKIYEVPIEYHARTYKQGKKIKLLDAFKALYAIFKYH
tara:strand:- start:828 stop:1532 length:705 start_codon:yes stop_codon:yes gene_type:complete